MKNRCLIRHACVGLTVIILASSLAVAAENVAYRSDPDRYGALCKPAGSGPFAAVVYIHGGLGQIVGGAPEETCAALAAAGYVGFSPIRRQTRPLAGHMDDVDTAIKFLKTRPEVDASRLALMGFSRGGLLTYQAATQRSDLKAVVIMASAVAPPRAARRLGSPSSIKAPVLLLVAENDTGSRRTFGRDTFEGMQVLAGRLRDAGVNVKSIVYRPFENDGHAFFFEIRDYWEDVVRFLAKHLK